MLVGSKGYFSSHIVFQISFPYLVSYFYFLGLFLTYSYVFSAFMVPCGLNSGLEFTGNLITELPYYHLISILDFFPALPLSVLPCWLNDTIQSYRPCWNCDRVEVFWDSDMSCASLTCLSHTFYCLPWTLMSSSNNSLNDFFPSGDISLLHLLNSCLIWWMSFQN